MASGAINNMGTCDLHINEAIALVSGLYLVPTEWLNVWQIVNPFDECEPIITAKSTPNFRGDHVSLHKKQSILYFILLKTCTLKCFFGTLIPSISCNLIRKTDSKKTWIVYLIVRSLKTSKFLISSTWRLWISFIRSPSGSDPKIVLPKTGNFRSKAMANWRLADLPPKDAL